MVTSLLSVVSTTGGSFDVHPQPVDLSAGGGEVTLQLQLSLPQSFHFSLSCHVLSEQFQFVHLQLGDLVLQLAQLTRHNIPLQRHHGHTPRHYLLTPGVQRHVVVVSTGLTHAGLVEGWQTGSLLGRESHLGLLWTTLHAVEAGGVAL